MQLYNRWNTKAMTESSLARVIDLVLGVHLFKSFLIEVVFAVVLPRKTILTDWTLHHHTEHRGQSNVVEG